jgi:hypothetical protein
MGITAFTAAWVKFPPARGKPVGGISGLPALVPPGQARVMSTESALADISRSAPDFNLGRNDRQEHPQS